MAGFRPLNGHTGEVARWIIGLVMLALVTYYNRDREAGERVVMIDVREQIRFEENQRSFSRIERAVEEQGEKLEALISSESRRIRPEGTSEPTYPRGRMFDR